MSRRTPAVPAMKRRLPMPARRKPRGATEGTSISASTQEIVTPSSWINENRKYFGISQQWWAKLALIDRAQGHLAERYRRKKEVPLDEETRLLEQVATLHHETRLFSEGDVIRASETVLINPVENVIAHLFSNFNFRVRTEKTETDSRVDVVWEILRPGTDCDNPKNWIECVILEFKNTNIIKVEHFTPGQVDQRDASGGVLTQAEAEKAAIRQTSKTLLKSNAIPLSKQARKYARRTPYVALFDWDTMALFDFTGTKPSSKEPICPRISFFSEYDVNDAKEGEGNGLTHRMFLMGFVANAIQERIAAAQLVKNGMIS